MLREIVIRVSNTYLPFRKLPLLLLGLCTFSIVFPSISFAKARPLDIPALYGEVVYRYNAESSDQLFIIGISHRDAITRINSSDTSQVQLEVYRIGDWLIHHEGVELLLPEGFFETGVEKASKEKKTFDGLKSSCRELIDSVILERFSANVTFINAEMLLKEVPPIRLRQVEEKDLDWNVRKNFLKLVSSGNHAPGSLDLKSRLDYLQERRTAAILQNAPEIIRNEFQHGYIKSRIALLTVGLSHISNMAKYLDDKK